MGWEDGEMILGDAEVVREGEDKNFQRLAMRGFDRDFLLVFGSFVTFGIYYFGAR